MSNDLITHLDNDQITGLTLEQAVEKMRGPVNTPITLTILRKGKDDPFDIKVVRDVIKINPVKARAEGDVAYVKVSTFNEQTHANLVKAGDGLKKQIGKDLKGFIIDLRNNPGGLLDQANRVSDAFLDGGEITSTRGRQPDDIQRYNARRGDMLEGIPVAVLINGGSASASEIVAGALQDQKRARVIGTRSFGKGSVQTVIPLSGGVDGALRLTTAKYYTPSGRSIQATGIDPDILVEQAADGDSEKEANDRLSEANLPKHLDAQEGGKKPHVGPVVKPKAGEKFDDYQLTYAMRLLRGQEIVAATPSKTTPN
jgi:carboxyl-terminal processing protease